MRRLLTLALLALVAAATAVPALARERAYGWCEQGNHQVYVSGVGSKAPAPSFAATYWQQSFPACTVRVYVSGTLTLATLYQDNSGTSLANPFTADATGFWKFYADAGKYDVQISGTGLTPYTIADVPICDFLTEVCSFGGATGNLNIFSNGVLIGTRPTINFVNSAGLSWTITDDPVNSRVNITQTVTGGGGTGCSPSGSANQVLLDSGSGGCTSDALATDNGTTFRYTGTLGLRGVNFYTDSPNTGFQNTFVGFGTGSSNTGARSTFVGNNAGHANTSGVENTFLGASAGAVMTTGSGNTFIGYAAGANNTVGNSNIFIGDASQAGINNAAGDTYIGGADSAVSGSLQNTFLGFNAGLSTGVSTAQNNTFLGYGATDSTHPTTVTNEIVIGANVSGNGSGTATIGSQSIQNGARVGNYTAMVSPPLSAQIDNNSVTGTTTNTLTKLTGLGKAIIAATTDTSGIIGICTGDCNVSGTRAQAVIAMHGFVNCVFDGATTAGDYVQISSTVAGNCHDAGATYPTSGQILGRVYTTNAAGGTYTIDLFGPGIQGSAGGGGSMVYPAAGVAVSTGTAWAASLTAPASGLVGLTDTQILTNKTLTLPVLGSYPFSSLPSAAANPNTLAVMTDAPTTGSCSTGGGTFYSICRSSGTSWLPVAATYSAAGITVSSGTGWTTPIAWNSGTTTATMNITGNAGGNAATASALAGTPSTCGAGVAAIGILSNGNATGCFTPGGGTYTPVTFSATPTFTVTGSANVTFEVTLTGNVTSSTVSGALAGANLGFIICQDATGSHTFAWPTGFQSSGTITPTASTCSMQTFRYDGTNYYATSAMTDTGTNGGIQMVGGTGSDLTPATNVGTFYYNLAANRWEVNMNNAGDKQLVVAGADINNSDQVTVTHLAAPLPAAQGGTNNAFFQVAGPATSAKTFTFPNANANVLTDNALVTTAQGGTGSAFFAISGPTAARTYTFPDANATITQTVASGTAAMGTGAISSGTCATVVTATATGVATTDTITYTPNTDPTAVTGYGPSATGSLYIWAYPTANTANFKVCNNTSGSITPAALTLNWKVTR